MGRKARITRDNSDVKGAIDYINSNYVYGELIKHEVFRKLSGLYEAISKNNIPTDTSPEGWLAYGLLVEKELKERERDYDSFIRRIKDALLDEHQKALRSDWGQGYVIVHPREQAEFAKTELVNRVLCGIRKATRIVNKTNTSKLSKQEVHAHEQKADGLVKLINNLNKAVTKIENQFTTIEESKNRAKSPIMDNLRGYDARTN